jgi:hypothetical protein
VEISYQCILTCTRIIVNLCSYCKVSIYLWTLSINDNYAQPCALGFVLSESGVGIVCRKLLYFLEMRFLRHRPHDGEFKRLMGQSSKVTGVGLLGGQVTGTDRLVQIGTTIVVLVDPVHG